jgi:translation initiation factor IF-1
MALLAATTFTVIVTDQTTPTAQTSSKTFQLTVNAAALTTNQAVPTTTLTAGTVATPFTPVTATGGFGTLSYALSGGTLPTGLTFSTSTGQISGTPTALLAATTFTVTVTDQTTPTAQTSSKTFSLTVNAAVLTTTQAVPSTILTAATAATPFTPVTAAGGFGTLSYALSGGTLPSGLTFSTSTGQISGTPTALLAATTFTVTVTDQTTPTAQTSSKTFSLTVNAAVLTTTQAVPSTILTAGAATTSFTPVTATGGFGTLSYALTGTLPTGLTFSTSTGQISGTPTTLLATTTFTVTVTDQTTPTAQTSSKTFSLTVNAATLTTTQAVPSTTLTVGTAATPFTPVTATGGFGTLSYALSGGTLPTGLTFSTSTGQISGTPTAALSTTVFSVTVMDQTTPTAQTSSKTFALTVGVPAPAVTAVNPNAGPTTGGTAVVISGTNLAGASAVRFGNTNATSFVVISPTQISAIAPAGSLGSVDVTVMTAAGLSPTSPADLFTYSIPPDSLKLRALQLNVTKVVSQNSGQAISGAIDDAISEGFSDNGVFATPGNSGVRFNFAAGQDDQDDQTGAATPSGQSGSAYAAGPASGSDPTGRSGRGRQASSRIDDAFAAINQQMPKKAIPKMFREEKQWLFWADVRGSGIDRWGSPQVAAGNAVTEATLHGLQLNALVGLTYKATPNFLLGVLGGYETFNYTEQDINGKLTGQGWTVGSYLGWRITPTLRYDAAVTYSGIGYDGTAGTAQGNFNGQRWMVSTGLTGTYKTAGFFIEPSARVYALWENENAYVDSLGTQQATHDFATGRASGGVKVSYPVPWSDGVLLLPYLGLYGDYYFTEDNATAIVAAGGVPLASTPLLQGWSARMTGGVGARLPGGAMLGVGAQYGGIGGNTQLWTFTAKAQVPF